MPAAAATLLRRCTASPGGSATLLTLGARGLAGKAFDELSRAVGKPTSAAQARTSE